MIRIALAIALLPAAAVAEIKLSGSAAMGLDAQAGKTQMVTQQTMTFTAAQTTDGGVTVGVVVRMQQGNGCGRGMPRCAAPPRPHLAAPTLFLQTN